MTSSTFTIEDAQRQEMVRQISLMAILSISGGRVTPIPDGIELPVSNGYRVRVQLTPIDDYTVTRVFIRGGKEFEHGKRVHVYADEVSAAAYYAGMFRSYDAHQWPLKSMEGL